MPRSDRMEVGAGGTRVQLLRSDRFPARHGMTLRSGGVSVGAFASLNVGAAAGDDPARVAENRARASRAFGVAADRLCVLEQVHGDALIEARAGAGDPPRADAMVSDDPSLAMAISVADCLPVLVFDAATGAAGAAHCGWRGTLAGLAATTVRALAERYGSSPHDVFAWIGPGIGGVCYQVGGEVARAFADAGFPSHIARPDAEGRYRLDLRAANRWALASAGVAPDRISVAERCTHCEPERFYSYRRDGVTGRHWAMVRPGLVGTLGNATAP